MAVRRSSVIVAVVMAGALMTGCGSGGRGTKTTGASASSRSAGGARGSTGRTGPGTGSGPSAVPAPAPTGVPANPAAVTVIRRWSDALRRGDVRSAAGYFALPSQMINGPDASGVTPVIGIHTFAEAEAANATLPCGAKLISADQRGRYINALFRLTDRPGLGGGCGSGAGLSARTNFVIAGNRIREWIRAPDDPKDNPAPSSPPGPPGPQGPPASPPSGPSV